MTLNETEFRRLIETHQSMVFSIALRITGERGAAEEIAQDVFLELYEAMEKVKSEEHVRFWLRRVTVFRATDCLRRRARRPEFQAEEWMEEGASRRNGRKDGQEGEFGSEQVGVRLERLLLSMPEALRGVIVLRYQEEMAPEEIAALLQQPVATVKSNLQRGLGLLRRKAKVMLKEFRRERVG
ncbi:MAG TPA: sigma-70 family RNA polymerase sigma factor [Granulicella sp.]|nr:sigma-70 family RNA polymerase sigma factor [Granulicella sp.]